MRHSRAAQAVRCAPDLRHSRAGVDRQDCCLLLLLLLLLLLPPGAATRPLQPLGSCATLLPRACSCLFIPNELAPALHANEDQDTAHSHTS